MRYYLFIFLCCITAIANAQDLLNWSDFTTGISFQSPSPDEFYPGFTKAKFSERLVALEGEEVLITGYFLVLDGNQSLYMLSKNPMASCFFCGNGGPETVAGLQFREEPSFTMDDLLSVKGILRLNRNNPNQYYYRIENAEAFRFE